VDFWRQQREHAPIHIDGSAVEKVKSFKFLAIHITDNLMVHPHRQCGEAQQLLFNLMSLKKFVLALKTLTIFYRCTS
jgi:hypothetical protein